MRKFPTRRGKLTGWLVSLLTSPLSGSRLISSSSAMTARWSRSGSLRRLLGTLLANPSVQVTPDIVEAQGLAAGTLGPASLDRGEIPGRRALDRQLSQAQ